MNKKLIALAIAGAVSMPALADTSNVTIYGTLDAGVDSVSNLATTSTGASAGTNNVGRVSDYGSFFGLKGSENVGNGVSAIWQIEQGIAINGGNNVGNYQAGSSNGVFGTGSTNNYNNQRNSFVGLSSTSAGTALVGIHDTPYKMATASMDPFADTIGDYNGIVGSSAWAGEAGSSIGDHSGVSASNYFDLRPSNVLAYVSPSMSGLTVIGAYVFGNATNTNQSGNTNGFTTNMNTSGQAYANNTSGNAYSIAALYAAGPLNLSAAYEKHNFGGAGNGSLGSNLLANEEDDAYKLGASYSVMDVTLSALYEHTNDNFGEGGANLLGHNTYYLSAKYKMGAFDIAAAFADAGSGGSDNILTQKNNFTVGGAKQYTLGGDYNFSKRTQVFLVYTHIANDNGAYYNIADTTAPVYGTPGNVGATSQPAGATISGVSLGVKHSF